MIVNFLLSLLSNKLISGLFSYYLPSFKLILRALERHIYSKDARNSKGSPFFTPFQVNQLITLSYTNFFFLEGLAFEDILALDRCLEVKGVFGDKGANR